MQTERKLVTWHVGNWGFWGWLETAIKGVGIAAGLIAFSMIASTGQTQPLDVPTVVASVLLGLLTLILSVLVILRISQREIISVVFSIFNALGHGGTLLYLLSGAVNTLFPLVFGVAFVIGELVKSRFLVVSGYTENGAQTPQMLMLVRSLAVVYALITLLVLL
jgi:hypothetical protein